MNINLFFTNLTKHLHLGNLLHEVERVYGGLMHTMYKVDTTSGMYAIKLLNPNVMKRGEAMHNFREADRLETILQNADIPIVPAIVFYDKKMQEMDGQYFYVYQWFDGKPLKNKDITKSHCRKMGEVLSLIHNIEIENKAYQRNSIHIDWDDYILLAKKQNSVILNLLVEHKALLCESENRGNSALHNLPSVMSICHNDMDCKNVLWLHDEFKIIDLECLAYANPYLELFELALCWSGYEQCNLNFSLFKAFIEAYFENRSKPNINWETIYDCNYGRLEWLEYNVKRALLLDCSSIEEQELGISQVKETIEHVVYYHNVKQEILSCLHTLFK